MSSPRNRDGDGFDDRPDEGSTWREPVHLGKDQPTRPDQADEADEPTGPPREQSAWQPPGWDLPPATSERPAAPPAQPAPEQPQAGGEQPVGGGLLGGRRPRAPGEVEQVFAYQGDAVGAQAWAVQHGWEVSDGTAPQDAVLAELVASSPVRATRDHRPAGVMRGRHGSLELVAFDVLYASGRYAVPEYAITAAPVLGAVPALRLSPARLWKHRTGGLVHLPSGDPEFDARWTLLAAEDGPAARRLVEDPAVRGLLLGSDDGDEFWTAAGFVAAIRPDGHRPELIEHHARLLTAVVGALSAAW
ncbi:hypothetical protein GCU56_20150 [Geodermatophilus sabuli]|uniref:Uncharacterized protein n=1 Tax=Geodermatophilus sabuli TaxID=1564158 RepID=A0A7K3W5S1_9ACTN|nr:hypothetical protein [Geodermatophilus sabuli]NEK60172.1 hypothetical protein [Geodermatophilus sabuli]